MKSWTNLSWNFNGLDLEGIMNFRRDHWKNHRTNSRRISENIVEEISKGIFKGISGEIIFYAIPKKSLEEMLMKQVDLLPTTFVKKSSKHPPEEFSEETL